MSQLLSGWEPSKAASVLAKYMEWHWEDPTSPYDADAPLIVRQVWSDAAWRRFEADKPLTRMEVAAHYLFRAASQEEGAARILLTDLGQSLLGEIVNALLTELIEEEGLNGERTLGKETERQPKR